MSQKLPVHGWNGKKDVSKFDEEFIKNSDEDSDKGYILKVDVEYPKDLLNIHGDLPFLADRKKIKKCNKFVCNTNDKENYVVHIRALKQALNHRLILTLFKKGPPTCFYPVTSTNVGISRQDFLTFSFNPFDRLV